MATRIWKGHIAFGLVLFPVLLQAAARHQSVSFNQLQQCDHARGRMAKTAPVVTPAKRIWLKHIAQPVTNRLVHHHDRD
jgi:non-homologous end joining protein Ku